MSPRSSSPSSSSSGDILNGLPGTVWSLKETNASRGEEGEEGEEEVGRKETRYRPALPLRGSTREGMDLLPSTTT